MDGTFGWKVPRMVHGKRCMAFFYTPVGIRKAKRKAFPGPRLQDVDPGVSCNSKSYKILQQPFNIRKW